jgi:hypothetical protein
MRYGLVNGIKTDAESYIKISKDFLTCPCCDSEIIPKLGDVKIWHFAHKSKNDCADWYKPMTQWHKDWQNFFEPKYREVVHICPETNEKHIADVKNKDGLIFEFQHSNISSKEIISREKFYGDKLYWIIDSRNFNIDITEYKIYDYKKNVYVYNEFMLKCLGLENLIQENVESINDYNNSLKFKYRSSFFDIAERPIFIDLNNDNMILVKYKKNEMLSIGNSLKIEYLLENKTNLDYDLKSSFSGVVNNGLISEEINLNVGVKFENPILAPYAAGKLISKSKFRQQFC